MIANIQNKPKWLFSQLGQLVIGVGLLALVFNYAYRFTVDRNINSTVFHVSTVVLGLIAFLIIRRDYVFVNRYAFNDNEISVHTLLGVKKSYATSEYEFVPSLHKAVNLPEQRATCATPRPRRMSGIIPGPASRPRISRPFPGCTAIAARRTSARRISASVERAGHLGYSVTRYAWPPGAR